MKKRIFLLSGLILAIIFVASLGSDDSSSKQPPLNLTISERENIFSFRAEPSDAVTVSNESVAAVRSVVEQIQPDYIHSHLYQMDEVKKRLDFDASVDSHNYSALNSSGNLDSIYLASLVKQNNTDYLSTKPFGYKDVEEDYISSLCEFIIQVVEAMQNKYPDIDWSRVYCNLGQMKILYDTGTLNYAQVNSDMVLGLNKNNTEIVLSMKGEDAFSRVLVHEVMHIIQIGCACENIENSGRRAGIAMYWDDFTLNTTDWTWLIEGSAERHMCMLTGGEAVSYQYKMDYLCSLTMSVLLKDKVEVDTIDTLCFYDDPERLFNAFDCKTEEQRTELLNMMITLQILQMQPKSFYFAYLEETGIDLMTADEQVKDQFSYELKPAICITLAKEFYENLISFMQSNQLSCNDVFFLINIFEGHLNQHLRYKDESKAKINEPFFQNYNMLRDTLFDALEEDNPDLDFHELYSNYKITAEENLLNADLSCLPKEKRDFLIERAQWQAELIALGEKVPTLED